MYVACKAESSLLEELGIVRGHARGDSRRGADPVARAPRSEKSGTTSDHRFLRRPSAHPTPDDSCPSSDREKTTSHADDANETETTHTDSQGTDSIQNAHADADQTFRVSPDDRPTFPDAVTSTAGTSRRRHADAHGPIQDGHTGPSVFSSGNQQRRDGSSTIVTIRRNHSPAYGRQGSRLDVLHTRHQGSSTGGHSRQCPSPSAIRSYPAVSREESRPCSDNRSHETRATRHTCNGESRFLKDPASTGITSIRKAGRAGADHDPSRSPNEKNFPCNHFQVWFDGRIFS